MSFFTPTGDPKLFRCSCGRSDCGAPAPNPDLLARLDNLRLRVGRPIIVTSGPRCAAHNAKEGGKPNSDHLTGDAADLLVRNGSERDELLAAIYDRPRLFLRVGIAATFVHVGLPTRNPGRMAWTY